MKVNYYFLAYSFFFHPSQRGKLVNSPSLCLYLNSPTYSFFSFKFPFIWGYCLPWRIFQDSVRLLSPSVSTPGSPSVTAVVSLLKVAGSVLGPPLTSSRQRSQNKQQQKKRNKHLRELSRVLLVTYKDVFFSVVVNRREPQTHADVHIRSLFQPWGSPSVFP